MTSVSRISRRAATIAFSFSVLCLAQRDPGVRGGPPGAGGPIAGLQVNESALFVEGIKRVTQLESVCDTFNDVTLGGDTGQNPNLMTLTNSSGLGPRFNGDQCSVCHQQPAIGGSGGFLASACWRVFASAIRGNPQQRLDSNMRPAAAEVQDPTTKDTKYHEGLIAAGSFVILRVLRGS